MGATNSAVSENSDPFSALCGLTNFVTNTEAVITLYLRLTSAEASVLASLLISGTEISHLSLHEEPLISAVDQLCSEIKCSISTIHTLSLGNLYGSGLISYSKLLQAFAFFANPALEQLSIYGSIKSKNDIHLDNALKRFTALNSLPAMASEYCPYGIPSLLTAIGKLQALESLSITTIILDSWEVEALATALKDLHIPS